MYVQFYFFFNPLISPFLFPFFFFFFFPLCYVSGTCDLCFTVPTLLNLPNISQIRPIRSTYMQELALITVHAPPYEVINESDTIRFYSTIFANLPNLFSSSSVIAEIFTIAFSNSPTPNRGKKHLAKL